MSGEIIQVAGRILAHELRRAVPVRETFALAPDPHPVFGVAPIRVVSEQRVQAIAFGAVDREPAIAVCWNPLSRESGSLEPFALAFSSYVEASVASGRLPRIWLPHRAAFEVVDLLGHRYRTNQRASEALRRMGAHCRAFVEEARYQGQQAIAVAATLLSEHVVTGQTPAEDNHLGALLAWVEPPAGVDPAEEAGRRSLMPAASLLERQVDDEVERLRRVGKGKGRAAALAQARISTLLTDAALREWKLLMDGRSAFWGLGLSSAPGIDLLLEESRSRIDFASRQDLSPPSRPHSLSRLLDAHELAVDLAEDIDMRGDPRLREVARREGRAIDVTVISVDQPVSSRHPCVLHLRTDQEVLRVRQGSELRSLDGSVQGRVATLRQDEHGGGTIIELRLTKGVRRGTRPAVGSDLDLVDTIPFDHRYLKQPVYSATRSANHDLVYGRDLPTAKPRRLPPDELVAVAESLRRGSP